VCTFRFVIGLIGPTVRLIAVTLRTCGGQFYSIRHMVIGVCTLLEISVDLRTFVPYFFQIRSVDIISVYLRKNAKDFDIFTERFP